MRHEAGGARREADGSPFAEGSEGAALTGWKRTSNALADARKAAGERARRAREAVQESARTVGSATEARAAEIAASAKSGYERTRAGATKTKKSLIDRVRQGATAAQDNSGAIAAFLSLPELLSWSESVSKSAATVYDKALDATYLRGHLGGGNHRLFDGGHDLVGAWERVRSASELDSFGDEVVGYVQALWKDGTTAKGLPFATWDKADFDKLAESLSALPGVSKAWVYDLASYDVFEVLSAGLGAVGILFALQHDDLERLSEVLGSMGVTSIIAANPSMGLTVILTTGYAYWRKEGAAGGEFLSAPGVAKGATLAGLSATMFAAMGLPVLVELGIVIVATQLTRKHVLENVALHALVARRLEESRSGASAAVGPAAGRSRPRLEHHARRSVEASRDDDLTLRRPFHRRAVLHGGGLRPHG